MKIRHATSSALFAVILAAAIPGSAQTAPAAAGTPRELAIVVVESLGHGSSRYDTFNRIDRVFTDVIKKKGWPVKVTVERFAANIPPHDTELRIFFKGIYEETRGDLTFHAWMTLDDRGTKHDFGMVLYRSYPRPWATMDDVLDEVVRGAALAAADKMEPILFPKMASPKT